MQNIYASRGSGKTRAITASYIMSLIDKGVISEEQAKALLESLYGTNPNTAGLKYITPDFQIISK